MGPRGCSTLPPSVGHARGRKGPHANVAPVAFRAASGDNLGNYTPKVAVFALPTDAAGTKGDFERETASIVAARKITLRRC